MEKKWRPMLRNENIDYSRGWFFVTIQAAFNKTIFGAIVGEKCVLNEFGAAVVEVIEGLESHYPGTYVDCFVVMPNHIHLVMKIEAGAAARQPEIKEARQPENSKLISERRTTASADPVISTFTSAQERAIFEKLMKEGRRFVRVCPGGLPVEGDLEPAIKAACDEGRGLLLSPVASGSGLNKQRAVWCNEYILKNAAEVWAGEITPGHTLASLVAALVPRKQ